MTTALAAPKPSAKTRKPKIPSQLLSKLSRNASNDEIVSAITEVLDNIREADDRFKKPVNLDTHMVIDDKLVFSTSFEGQTVTFTARCKGYGYLKLTEHRVARRLLLNDANNFATTHASNAKDVINLVETIVKARREDEVLRDRFRIPNHIDEVRIVARCFTPEYWIRILVGKPLGSDTPKVVAQKSSRSESKFSWWTIPDSHNERDSLLAEAFVGLCDIASQAAGGCDDHLADEDYVEAVTQSGLL